MSHPHKRIQCKCGNVVMTCRCPDANKVVETVETCEKCVSKVGALPETPAQQRQRIALALAEQIRQIESRHGSNQAAGLAVFGWLVDARIEIENLKRKLQ